jgi:hypothetical protein
LTELTLWEKWLERLWLIEQSNGENKRCFSKGGGVCRQLEQRFPTTNMELKMSHYANLYETTAQQILAAQFKRAESRSKSRIITHHTAPAWKKLWWRIRLFFINRRYENARRLQRRNSQV